MAETPATRPLPDTYAGLANLLELSLLRQDLNDEDVVRGCRLAVRYGLAAAAVRPTDAELAGRILEGTGVALASVVGFPFGFSTTPAKLYELRDLLRRGVREVTTVMNTGKLLARQFHYLETELLQMVQVCHENGAVLTVEFDGPSVGEDLKVIACKICKRVEVDLVTATAADLALIARLLKDACVIKAAGVQTLDEALEVYCSGAGRVHVTHAAEILDAWRQRLNPQPDFVS